MKKENLFQSLEILVRDYDRFPMPPHQHSFYELCYIASGSGVFVGDGEEVPFTAGDIFVVKPSCVHCYRLDGRCKMFYLRFSGGYLDSHFQRAGHEALSAAAGIRPLRLDGTDRDVVAALAGCLEAEGGRPLPDEQLSAWWVDSIIRICIRRQQQCLPAAGRAGMPDEKVMLMLRHIQSNLGNPPQLRMKALGELLGLSESYVGKYFKRSTGESLQEYVANCRLKEVERLLAHTDMAVGEIASALGFTDNSHLAHLFKKRNGVTPADFRKTIGGRHGGKG